MWSTDIDVEKLKIEYEKLKDENMKLHKQVEELKIIRQMFKNIEP